MSSGTFGGEALDWSKGYGGEAEPALEHYRLALRHNPKLYKTVLFAMVSQPSGCFWLDLAELKRQVAPEGNPR